jgi:hypothetical protein
MDFGGGRLALEKKDRSSPRIGGVKGVTAGTRPKAGNSVQGNVGSALRSAYEQTVSENIPPEMLDLLGELS